MLNLNSLVKTCLTTLVIKSFSLPKKYDFLKVLQQVLLYCCFLLKSGISWFSCKKLTNVGGVLFFFFHVDLLCFTNSFVEEKLWKSGGSVNFVCLLCLLCACMHVCGLCLEVRGQHTQVGSLYVSTNARIQVSGLGNGRSYSQSRLAVRVHCSWFPPSYSDKKASMLAFCTKWKQSITLQPVLDD